FATIGQNRRYSSTTAFGLPCTVIVCGICCAASITAVNFALAACNCQVFFHFFSLFRMDCLSFLHASACCSLAALQTIGADRQMIRKRLCRLGRIVIVSMVTALQVD